MLISIYCVEQRRTKLKIISINIDENIVSSVFKSINFVSLQQLINFVRHYKFINFVRYHRSINFVNCNSG
jgi:hypothetical protein